MKQHPAEAFQAELIARAVRYEVCIFLGVGQYARKDAADLVSAMAAKTQLQLENPNGRSALIYAITDDGRPALIVDPMKRWRSKMEMNAEALAAKRAKATEVKRAWRAKQKAAAQAEADKMLPAAIAKATPEPKAAKPKPAKQSAQKDRLAAAAAEKAAARNARHEAAKAKAKPAAAPAPKGGKRAEAKAAAMASAMAGQLPALPDMSAETHKYWKRHLDAIVALAEAGDIDGLKANAIEPKSTSRKLICTYRDLAIIALEHRAQAQAA